MSKILSIQILLYLIYFVSLLTETEAYASNYEEHNGMLYEVVNGKDCIRKCRHQTELKVCEYSFEAEWWHTMTEDCLSCPNKTLECFNKNCITGDGSSRLVRVINKQLPGPSIQVCEGDLVRVRVKNNFGHGSGLSIHWHGIHQRGTQFSDGVPYITQCYIDYKQTFKYEFVAHPGGTHYWHPHSSLELGDGMNGALIVRKSAEYEGNHHLYDEDNPDHYILLQTIREEIEIIAYNELMTNNDDTLPVSVLINGRAQRVDFGDRVFTPMTTYQVTQGKRYRFRIIFAGPSGCQLVFSIDQHPIVVIATEVGAIQPIVVDALNMAPGHRFDIVIDAHNKLANYRILAEGSSGCENILKANGAAILSYDGSSDQEMVSSPLVVQDGMFQEKPILLNFLDQMMSDYYETLLLSDLRSLGENMEYHTAEINRTPDIQIYLRLKTFHNPDYDVFMRQLEGNPTRTLIDHISFVNPPYPLYSMDKESIKEYSCTAEFLKKSGIDCNVVFCECTHLYNIPLGSVSRPVVSCMFMVKKNRYKITPNKNDSDQFKD